MKVKINILEVCNTLANNEVLDEFHNDPNIIYSSSDTSYSNEAREVYIKWYDYFFKTISNMSIIVETIVKEPSY